MAILFDKMCNNYVVIKYHAVLAFTQLLYDKEAL